jgi:uncharacterized protein
MAPATPPPPAHPITDAQVHELAELNGSSKIKDQLSEYMIGRFSQAPFMPKDVIDDLRASMAKLDVDATVAATYKKYLSTEDATKVIEFYRSPAGKQLIKVEPVINQEVQRNVMQAGSQAARAVVDKHRAEIDAAQKQWQAQHAPKPPAPGAGGSMSPAPSKPATPSTTTPPAKPQQ